MNLADVRIGDRCWTGYCPTVDERGQNATVSMGIFPGDSVIYVKTDNGREIAVTPGVSLFWSRPEFPEKPRRMVKREVKGCCWTDSDGDWQFTEGGCTCKEHRPAVLTFEEEEP